MFSFHISLEEFKNATIIGHFGFVYRKTTRSGKSLDNRELIVKTLRLNKCFLSALKQYASVFKFLRFEERFSKSSVLLRICVDVAEIKLRFPIPSAWYGRCVSPVY